MKHAVRVIVIMIVFMLLCAWSYRLNCKRLQWQAKQYEKIENMLDSFSQL